MVSDELSDSDNIYSDRVESVVNDDDDNAVVSDNDDNAVVNDNDDNAVVNNDDDNAVVNDKIDKSEDNSDGNANKGNLFKQSSQLSLSDNSDSSGQLSSHLSRYHYRTTSQMNSIRRHRRSIYRSDRNTAGLKEHYTPIYRYRNLDFPPDHVGDSLLSRKMHVLKAAENNLIHNLASKNGSRKDFYYGYLYKYTGNYHGRIHKSVSLKASFLERLKHAIMQGVVRNGTEPCDGCSIIPASTNYTANSGKTIIRSRGSIHKFIGNKEVKVVESRMYCSLL